MGFHCHKVHEVSHYKVTDCKVKLKETVGFSKARAASLLLSATQNARDALYDRLFGVLEKNLTSLVVAELITKNEWAG